MPDLPAVVTDFAPFVIVGITTGAIYALVATGLVLTYTTSGVFNFAHGAVGMAAAYIFHELRAEHGAPTPLALFVAVLLVAPTIGIVIDRVLLRRLEGATPTASVVVSLGLLVALQGLVLAVFGGEVKRVAPIFPTDTFELAGVQVGVDQFLVLAISVAAGISLAVYLRRTRIGLRNRAVVSDRELAELMGTDTRRVTTRAWMLGCAFAALAGVLFAPVVQLNAVLLTLLVVQAFGAAIVGRLRSLGLTNVGAYAIAIVAALITKYAAGRPSLAGLPTSLPFLVLFVILVLSNRGSFPEAIRARQRQVVSWRPMGRSPLRSLLTATALAALLPTVLTGSQLLTATTTLTFVLIFASLSLVLGVCRQVSLCHAVFVAFGATTLSHLSALPAPIALLLAAAVLIPLGALVAIPALRLSGLFLALATFGFGVLAQYLLFPTDLAFGGGSLIQVSRPSAATGDTAFYYLVLGVVVLGVAVVELLRTTRLGRILRVAADSPIAVESLGINPTAARVLAFCLAAFLAALAGGLQAWQFQTLTYGSFDFFQSLTWVAVLVAGGPECLLGSIAAALLLVALPGLLSSPAVAEWLPVAFGVAAIALAQQPNGVVSLLKMPDIAALAARRAGRMNGRRRAERLTTSIGSGSMASRPSGTRGC